MLHLDDALKLAREGNWDLLSARAGIAIADAGVRTAHEIPNPTASFSTSKVHFDGQGDATPAGNDFWARSYDTIAQLGQTFEIGGKRYQRTRSAAAGADAARAGLADERRTLEAAIVRAYVGAALAEANARIARETSGYLSDEARIATIRFEAGDISKSDRDQIEIAATRLELDARSAEADAVAQRNALAILLGAKQPDGVVVIADSLEALAERAVASPPAPTFGMRADVVRAQADLRRAESDVRLQRALRLPDPTFFVQLEHQPPDRPNTLGAGVSLPLPLWSRNAGAIEAAEIQRQDAARAVAQTEAQVAADVATARAAYEEAAARWQRYRDGVRPSSDEIRRSVSLAYEKGGASLLDLLQAERSDDDVRRETMQAASDAAIAAASLRAATLPYLGETQQP